ncbi:hypothetical protein EVG20_g4177 [Dentipellis fragilis]|uniref:Uncharacterized protein n=1 Tax=Dentipellis fragilis TaxID=205917 RepID=A0A4Y9YZ22_9AGAM|nr:hypothetical protein EVG20_g4177 [Dentipellis fragilis]
MPKQSKADPQASASRKSSIPYALRSSPSSYSSSSRASSVVSRASSVTSYSSYPPSPHKMPMIKKEESPPFIPVPASMAYMDARMDAYIKREEARYKREDVKPNIKYEDVKPDIKFKRRDSPSGSSASSVSVGPDGCRRDRLPQFAYKWQVMAVPAPSTTEPINFQFYDVPTGWGVNMVELMSKGLKALGEDMVGAYDQVFSGSGLKTVSLRIAWPGYQSSEWVRPIHVKTDYGNIYRVDFAAQIALQFSRFFEKTEYENPKHGEPGWLISRKGGVSLRQLYLVSVVNIFGDVWQADVIVERR